MGDIRQKQKETFIPKKPGGNLVLWQASDGSLYALDGTNDWWLFDTALKAEYGEKYKREIAGLVTKESLNALFSVVKSVPGAGVVESTAITGIKILAKGVSNNIGDAVAGKELTPSTVAYNFYSELFKFSNYAPGGKINGTDFASKFQNSAYKYKYFITSKDPGFSKVQLFKFAKSQFSEELVIKGEIGFFSIGKQGEKAVVKFIKHQLGHKPEGNIVEVDLSKYAQNWDGTDIENFERFIKQGYNETEAISLTNRREKGLSYDIDRFKTDIENTVGVFGQMNNTFNWNTNHYFNSSLNHFKKAFDSKTGGGVTKVLAGDFSDVGSFGLGIVDFLAGTTSLLLSEVPYVLSLAEDGIKGFISSAIKIGQVSSDAISADNLDKLTFSITRNGAPPPRNMMQAVTGQRTMPPQPLANGVSKVGDRFVNSVLTFTNVPKESTREVFKDKVPEVTKGKSAQKKVDDPYKYIRPNTNARGPIMTSGVMGLF